MSKLHKNNKQHDGGDEEEVAATIRKELIKNKQNKSCQDNKQQYWTLFDMETQYNPYKLSVRFWCEVPINKPLKGQNRHLKFCKSRQKN